jgi:hypothetical protein
MPAPILRSDQNMLRLIAIPLPVTIYALVISATALLVSVPLVVTGTLPRWVPSGFVDAQGQRAVLSAGVYRTLGAAGVVAGVAAAVVTLGAAGTSLLIGFGLVGLAFASLVIAAVQAWSERRARSLRPARSTRSTILWSVLAVVVVVVLNYGMTFSLFFGARRR